MSKGKRNRYRRRNKVKDIDSMEVELARLTEVQLRAERRVEALRTKVAAQEGLIEEAKEDAKEAAVAS